MPTAIPDVAIIGAGPAGLGAGLALGEAAVVLEQAGGSGGLGGTVELAGAVFDLGGHSFHTPHPEIRDLVFRALPMEEQRRQAWCHVAGEWIPYPFQKNLALLKDEATREACLAGLRRAGDGARAPNFDRYIDARFGAGVARHFMRPYNEKLWGPDLSRLATDWTAERIAAPENRGGGAELGVGQRMPLQGDTMVGYPARGGFGEIFRVLGAQLPNLRFGQRVIGIDLKTGELTTAGGDRLAWGQLISTLPLPRLLALIADVPKTMREAVAELAVLPVNLVLVALAGRLDTVVQRVYSSDPGIVGHKIVLNHNSSTYLRSLPHHGIQVEVSGNRGESDEALARLAVAGLRKLRLLSDSDEIAATRVVRLPFGYPVPTHERARIVGDAAAWLESRGIWTLGRFGQWDYINSDEALHRGLRLGARLAADRPAPSRGRQQGEG